MRSSLVILLPILVVFALLVPEFQSTWAAVIGLVVYCGDATWLTQFARDRGKALEPKLFQAGGGKPSVAMLLHRDARIPTATKDRYRAFLERNVPHLKLASPQDEERSPTKADEGYESATAWLLANEGSREVPASLRGERQLRLSAKYMGAQTACTSCRRFGHCSHSGCHCRLMEGRRYISAPGYR